MSQFHRVGALLTVPGRPESNSESPKSVRPQSAGPEVLGSRDQCLKVLGELAESCSFGDYALKELVGLGPRCRNSAGSQLHASAGTAEVAETRLETRPGALGIPKLEHLGPWVLVEPA